MRKLIAFLLLTTVFAIAGVAQQAKSTGHPAANRSNSEGASKQLPSRATVESFLQHTFGYDPSIQWQILEIAPSRAPGIAEVTVLLKNAQGQQSVRLYVTPDEKHTIVGDMMPFGADPFAAARKEIAARANGVTRGPANAPVTIVEFSDLECPSCKAAQPTVDKLLADEPDVRFIFQNFPLEGLHPWAHLAASYADCVGRESNAAFWKFIEKDYADQEQITALLPQNAANAKQAMQQAKPAIEKKLQELATASGANAQKVAQCAAEPATAARIQKSIELGESLGVTGTPTLFVNGRKIANVNGMPYEVLKRIVDFAKQKK